MKIAIVGSRGIPARYGGFETCAEELAVRLVQQGIEVTVYCEAPAGDEAAPEMYQGVRLVYIAAPPLGSLTTIRFDLFCLWHARKDFDLVYMLGYGTSIFCFIPRLWGSEVWINMDGVEWARSKWGTLAKLWFKLMEAAAMWTPDRLIADAQGILTHLQARHSRLPPTSVIAYGAPLVTTPPATELLNRWQLTAGGYYLIVCRLVPENSVLEIISGFLQANSTRPLIVIGGTDPATPYVEKLLRSASSRVRFIGTVYDQEQLQTLRYHAFAYCHGHTVGGTNPSLLEALGCGNLVIAHDNEYNREVAGESAVYFRTAEQLVERIGELESCSAVRHEQLRSMAQARISTGYNWDAIARAYYEILPHHQSWFPVPTRAKTVRNHPVLQQSGIAPRHPGQPTHQLNV
jgi:glycosyltransferase involved in cell wall biosynthesis